MSNSSDRDALGETIGAEPVEPVEPRDPAALGERYRISGQLGRGGMGTVFLARDRVLDIEVALKVVDASGGGLAELRHEVLLAQQVTHENVCRTYDLELVGGRWLVKMEYVRGETLAQRLHRERRLPVAECQRIARQLAEGLDAAHRRGIVHRDLKPQNVMLEDGTGRIVIMDFGVARRTDDTHDPRLAGTPHYIAPEQLRGDPIDGRADLYALGCVLYEMLVGDVVFPADTPLAALVRHTDDALPDLRASLPDLPGWLAVLLRALLDKDPGRRPRDARAVATALAGPAWTPEIRQLREYAENSDAPALSHDGTHVAYISDRERRTRFRLYLEPVAGGSARALTPPTMSIMDATWSADGTTLVVVTIDGRVFRVDPARDPERDELVLEPITDGVTGAAECAEGLVVARPRRAGTTIFVRDPQGVEREVHHSPTAFRRLRCDATGRLALYARAGTGDHPPADLWLVPLDGTPARALTTDGLENSRGVFHPDGASVFYSSSRTGHLNLWEQPLSGGSAIRVTTGFGPDDGPSISADGKLLLYNLDDSTVQLFAVPLSGGQPRAISTAAYQDFTSPVVGAGGREVLALATPWGRSARAVLLSVADLRVHDLGEATAATFHGEDLLCARGGAVFAVPRDGGRAREVTAVDGVVEAIVAEAAAIRMVVRSGPELGVWEAAWPAGVASRVSSARLLSLPAPASSAVAELFASADGYRIRIGDIELPSASASVAWTADGRSLLHGTGDGLQRFVLAHRRDEHVLDCNATLGFALAPTSETLFVPMTSPHVRRRLVVNFGDRPRP